LFDEFFFTAQGDFSRQTDWSQFFKKGSPPSAHLFFL
jgi:hypothetical protein